MTRQSVWLMVVLLLVSASAVGAQSDVPVDILRDDEQLVIVIPGDDPVSLVDFALQVETEYYPLAAYDAFNALNFEYVEAPACFVLRLGESDSPLPTACPDPATNRVYIADLFAADIFWHDAPTNTDLAVIVNDGVNPLTLCPAGQPTCTVAFTYKTPNAELVALAADDEVLLILTQFRQISGAALEPHLEWEFMLNRELDALETPVNARILVVPRIIESHDAARELSAQYNATIVVWGQVRGAGIESFYTITPRQSRVSTSPGDTLVLAVESPDEIAVFVSRGGDSIYVLNFIIGQLLFFGDQHEAALPHFDAAVEFAPEGREVDMGVPALHFYRGYVHGAILEQPEREIADYDRALALDPDLAEAYNNRGVAYRNLGDYERAIADYERALALDPDYFNAYYNRGNAYSYLGEYERAITDYERALALDPDYAVAYTNRGAAYHSLGDYERAIADYERALALDPDYAEAYNNRGVAYRNLGEYERALADYERALALDPDYAYAYNNRGIAYRNLGEYERAIADYERALALDPDYAFAYWGRGTAHYQLGDLSSAAADYRAYEQITGRLEPFMQQIIAEAEAAGE